MHTGSRWKYLGAGSYQMLAHTPQAAQPSDLDQTLRVYCICCFERGAVVPQVKLVDAASDEQAVQIAQTIRPGAEWEVWDQHRLVAHFQSAPEPATF
jgi:hypothetical protein